MPITVVRDSQFVEAQEGMYVDTVLPPIVHKTKSGDDYTFTWTENGIDFTLSYTKSGNDKINIKLERSDDSDKDNDAKTNGMYIEKKGSILTIRNGSALDGILPDSIETTSDEGSICKTIKLGEQKVVFSATRSGDDIISPKLTIEGYTINDNDALQTLVKFGNLLVCDNGSLFDGMLPDKILRTSDTSVKLIYPADNTALSLSWSKDGKTLKDIKLTKLKGDTDA